MERLSHYDWLDWWTGSGWGNYSQSKRVTQFGKIISLYYEWLISGLVLTQWRFFRIKGCHSLEI